jgi:hypothetical protein
MKQNIPGAVAVVIAIIVGVLVVVFGFRKVSGADNDVTQETINRYQNMSKQTFSGQGSNGGGPSQMTHGAPPAKAPATTAGSSH